MVQILLFIPSSSHVHHRGDDASHLIAVNQGKRYDVVILSEVLWRDTYPLQEFLAQSVASLVEEGGFVVLTLVHRPCVDHSAERDLEFIEHLCKRNVVIANKREMRGSEVGDEEAVSVYTYTFQHRTQQLSIHGLHRES